MQEALFRKDRLSRFGARSNQFADGETLSGDLSQRQMGSESSSLSTRESYFSFLGGTHVSLKRKVGLGALGLLVFCFSIYTTIASPTAGNRQFVPKGEVARFHAGQSVSGSVISFLDSQGQLGRTWYECYMRSARKEGQVKGPAAINYDPVEVRNVKPCSSTKPNPGPMFYTGPGVTMRIEAGHIVEAVAIEQVGGPGKTAFKCVMRLITASFVTDGTIDPHPAIIAAATPCSQTEQNPGRRTLSGNGKLWFKPGEPVLGDYIVYQDGSVFRDCYITTTKMSGWLTGGVRNYWPSQNSDLPVCR